MKKSKLTNNLGLKIASLIAAFVLWLVVINIDDPVINRTYTGIPVEILNESVIADEGKCYEVLGGTDTITVVVSAKRSVLDDMSRDYIKATADMKSITFLDTVPIEVKVTRFADTIDSVTSRTENLQLRLENVVKRDVPLEVVVSGEVADGYLLSSANAKYDIVKVSGPESLVLEVESAKCEVNVSDLSADESVNVPVKLYDCDGYEIDEEKLELEQKNVSVNVLIWATKEVPVTCTASGVPAEGYSMTGTPVIYPGSVVITGRSAYLSSMSSLVIPSEHVSVAGATDTVVKTINLKSFLPEGITFADSEFDGKVSITIDVEANDRKTVDIPMSNITIENVPEGYKATITDIGPALTMDIQGKGDTFDRFDGSLAIGVVDASALVPRNQTEELDTIHTGVNDGRVNFTFPTGVSEVLPVYLEVIVEVDNGQE